MSGPVEPSAPGPQSTGTLLVGRDRELQALRFGLQEALAGWGAPTIGGFPGDFFYSLGTGSLVSLPIAGARFNIALQPMK